MLNLTLTDLPAPPSGKTGWPWTEASPLAPPQRSDGAAWPRITIVTPSFNQGHFIEETIRSILLQGYPNIEYFVMDGGSIDGAVAILEKYASHLTYWVSEPDRGQTHAINKGLALATGDIVAYLNSDDYYLPGTLCRVAERFIEHPETDLLHGRCRYVDVEGHKIGEQFGNITRLDEILNLWDVWWAKRQFVQPEVFWSKRIMQEVGSFQENLHYVMDYEYWLRIIAAGGKVSRVDSELTCFRFTPDQKSNHSEAVARELLEVVRPWFWGKEHPISFAKRLELQGKWLQQAVFQEQINSSVARREKLLVRWVKLLALSLGHPQMFFAPSFRRKLRKVLLRL